MKPGIQTLTIKLIDPATSLSAASENALLTKLAEQVNKAGFLARGKLHEFTDTSLAGLAANYAANISTAKYREPAELTEDDWYVVLENTRALH